MARKQIGINLDDNDMNNVNSNFIELYGFLGFISEAKKAIENFINGTGVVTNKMLSDDSVTNRVIAPRGVHNDNIADLAVRENHIAAGSVSEQKIANGAVNNRHVLMDTQTLNQGKMYPLINMRVGGGVKPYNENVKNYIIDASVDNAEHGRVYQIESIRNGYYDNYGLTIASYQKPTNGSIYESSKKRVITYNDPLDIIEKENYITMISKSPNPTGEIVSVTFEKGFSFLNLSETESGTSFGLIIDPSKYVYKNESENEEIDCNIFMDKKVDRFTIYTEKSNGNYLGIEIRHQKKGIESNASSNFDLWLVRTIKEFSKSGEKFTAIRSIIDDSTPTTMDLMIKESDDMDYMGGINHGDEVNKYTLLLVDGQPVNLNSVGFYNAKEIKLVQRNNLYRDSVYTEGVLEHLATVGKEHIFNRAGYTLHNTVNWHESINIVQAFLGSLSLYRTDEKGNGPLWHTVISDITYTPYNLKTVGGQMPSAENVDKMILIGEKISCVVTADRLDRISGNQTWVANFADQNSKLYFSYVPNGYTTSVDEIWKQDTNFKFELGD